MRSQAARYSPFYMILSTVLFITFSSQDGHCDSTHTLAMKYATAISSSTLIAYDWDKKYVGREHPDHFDWVVSHFKKEILPPGKVRLVLIPPPGHAFKTVDLPSSAVLDILHPRSARISFEEIIENCIQSEWVPPGTFGSDTSRVVIEFWLRDKIYVLVLETVDEVMMRNLPEYKQAFKEDPMPLARIDLLVLQIYRYLQRH